MVVMSETKEKKKNRSINKVQLPDSAEQSNTAKQKRKRWMVEKYKKKKLPHAVEKAAKKPDKLVPPTDGQHFSANWKKLQEVNEHVDYSLSILL